jgi:hypothetical protein
MAPTGAATVTETTIANASATTTALGDLSPSSLSYPLTTPAASHDDALAGVDEVQRLSAEKNPEFAAALSRMRPR